MLKTSKDLNRSELRLKKTALSVFSTLKYPMTSAIQLKPQNAACSAGALVSDIAG